MSTTAFEERTARLAAPATKDVDDMPDGYNPDLAYVMAVFSSAMYNLWQDSPLQLPTGWSVTQQFYYTDLFGETVPIGAVLESSSAVTVAFRGTQTWQEIVVTDADALTAIPSWTSYYIVHLGFNNLYYPIRQNVMNILDGIYFGQRPLYITGHSLGGALATLAALDYASNNAPYPVAEVYTFGSPRVASYITLVQYYDSPGRPGTYTYRVARPNDIITKIPPPGLYYHVDQLCSLSGTTSQDGYSFHSIDGYIDLLNPA